MLARRVSIVSKIDMVGQLNLIEVHRELERIIARRAARLLKRGPKSGQILSPQAHPRSILRAADKFDAGSFEGPLKFQKCL